MATNFNINDFLGGGSSSNFGNFGDTSSAADLFAADVFTPAPNAAPSNPFAVDQFQDSYFNSPQVDASLLGFQGSPNTFQNLPNSFQNLQTPNFGSPFSPPSFASLERQMQSASGPSNPLLGNQSFEQNASNLISNLQRENESLNTFINNFAPRISSEPGAGLEPFNRFNPTTQQFEQLFGNQSARLPSADIFVEGETGFNDGARFLESIRNQAQQNADNFLGQPVTDKQIGQAGELAGFMGTDSSFSTNTPAGGEQVLGEVKYEQPTGSVSAEDLNKLLNMQQSQQAAIDNKNRMEFMKTDPTFKGAIADMDKDQQESQAAYDRASTLRTQELENRIPFNATFNYDKQGNKVLAGESARAAGEGPDITQAEARAIAKGKMYRASAADKAEGIQAEMAVQKRLQDKQLNQSAEAVQGFLGQYNDPTTGKPLGSELDIEGIRAGIEATGSPQAFVKMYGAMQADLSASQKTKLDDSMTGYGQYGASLKDATLMKSRDSNETLMMGQNMDTGQWGTVGTDGVFKPEDITKWSPTSSANVKDARNKAMELQTGIFEESGGVGTLEKFKKSREMSQEGFAEFATNLRGKIQNFVGQDLDPQAMRNAVSRAGFQALLGEIRIDVLGPGVLTEIDAQRLIEAMGGYGVTSDRDTSLVLIQQLIDKKKRTLEGKITVYDQYRTTFDILEDELPFMSADNIERVRMGDLGRNKNINTPVNLNSLFNP